MFWRQFSRDLVNASSWLDSGFLTGLYPPLLLLLFFLGGNFNLCFRGSSVKTISDSISRWVLWMWTTGLTCFLPPFVWGSARESEAVAKRHSSDALAKINCISCTFAPMEVALLLVTFILLGTASGGMTGCWNRVWRISETSIATARVCVAIWRIWCKQKQTCSLLRQLSYGTKKKTGALDYNPHRRRTVNQHRCSGRVSI